MPSRLSFLLDRFALIFCAALAACGAAWLAWEVAAHALGFDGYFANGAFQLLDPLRRIMAGQVYGRDFLNFHGIGTVWLHLPVYLLGGAGLRASEISRNLMSGLCHAAAAVALTYAFRPALTSKKQAWAFGLLFFASGALLFTRAYLPWTSILGVRSFFPLLLAAALVSRRPIVWATLALAAALITSVEQGVAAAIALLGAIAVTFILPGLTERRMPLLGAALAGLGLFAAVLFIATSGDMAPGLRYALVDIPGDQFWYFGAPPNAFLPRHAFVLAADPGFARFAATYVLGWAATGYLVMRARALAPVAVFLMVYATFGLASQLGYIYSGNLHGSERAIFALVLATLLSAAGPRLFAVPTVLAGLYIAIWGARDFKALPVTPLHKEEHYLSQSWRDHVAAVGRISPAGTLWSVYAGLPEALRGSFHPDFDYIIHALGPRHRERYVDTFLKRQPDIVRLDPLWRWGYGGWLLLENWAFYREVFRRYEPVYIDKWGSLWSKATNSEPWNEASAEPAVKKRGCFVIPPRQEDTVYSVEASYSVRNPWVRLPVLGKTPRLFLNILGTISPELQTVSLPPPDVYGGSFIFPVIVRAGQDSTLCPEAVSFFGGVQLILKSISARPEALTSGARQYLFNQGSLNP